MGTAKVLYVFFFEETLRTVSAGRVLVVCNYTTNTKNLWLFPHMKKYDNLVSAKVRRKSLCPQNLGGKFLIAVYCVVVNKLRRNVGKYGKQVLTGSERIRGKGGIFAVVRWGNGQ